MHALFRYVLTDESPGVSRQINNDISSNCPEQSDRGRVTHHVTGQNQLVLTILHGLLDTIEQLPRWTSLPSSLPQSAPPVANLGCIVQQEFLTFAP